MKRSNIKAVLDTNIFIAAWFEESTECEKILELVKSGKIRLLFAQDTIGELIYLVKNFARYNIDDVSERILLLKWIVELFYYSLSINTMNVQIEKSNDEHDDMFLKCAIAGNADYLITDDMNHGLHEREFDYLKGTVPVTCRRLIETESHMALCFFFCIFVDVLWHFLWQLLLKLRE